MSELLATFGIDWRLLLVQAANFAVLLLVLWYVLYRPVMRLIDERREKIESGVRSADAAHEQLASAKEERGRIIGGAAQEAEQIVASAKTRADEKGAEVLGSAHERADGVLKDATARAREIEREAFTKSEKEITRAAVLAAEKVIHERATAQK